MLSLVIQAGGESKRMGQDKALVPFLGRPLVQYVMERLSGLANEVLVTTNCPQDLAFLGVRGVADLLPGTGALGGLYTALKSASHPLVAVVACDMPFASARLLSAERDWLEESGSDAVVPRSKGGLEPFHAIYHRPTCLPHIQAALQAGKRRVDAWFSKVKIRFVSQEEVLPYDPFQRAFWNVNTLEELAQAEEIARQSGTAHNQEARL